MVCSSGNAVYEFVIFLNFKNMMNSKTKILILVTGLLFSFCLKTMAHRETTYLLQGTFGNRQTAIEIIDVDGFWAARYFFQDTKKDVFMMAECDTNICKLVSKKYDPETKENIVIEKLDIYEDSLYKWHGTWYSPLGDTLPVSLRPISIDSIRDPLKFSAYKNRYNAYTLLKISDIRFKKVDKEKHGKGLKIIWYKDPISGVRGFRIAGKYNDSVKEKVNILLEMEHIKSMLNYYSCGSVAYQGDYLENTVITFVNKHLISYIRQVRSNCQGKFAENDYVFQTFSVDSARFIHLEDIFWMGNGVKPRFGSQEYFKYRYNIFNARVLEMFSTMYPEKIKTEFCDYSKLNDWHFPDWFISEKGVHLVNRGFSLKEECKYNLEFIIPFDKYKEFFNSDLFKD